MKTFLDSRSIPQATGAADVAKRILVAADNPTLRSQMVAALDRAGHHVETASDG